MPADVMTNDQDIGSNPSLLYQDYNIVLPNPEKNTGVLTDYGYVVGSQCEDVGNEPLEGIKESHFWDTLDLKLPESLYSIIGPDFIIEFWKLYKVVNSPTAEVAEDPTKSIIWTEIEERFNEIAQREYDWDALESLKPKEESLVRAKRLIEKLLDDILSAGYLWNTCKPLISSDEDGYITVRWRGGGKRLQLRIEEDEVRYIKLWKEHNKRKMHTDRTRSDNCFEIWEWLINDG